MLHQNLIAGEWAEGVAVNRNLNPSNLDDVVGEYARADARQAETAIDAAHEAFKALVAGDAGAALGRARPHRHRDPRPQGRARPAALARGGQDPAGRRSARRSRAGPHLQVLRRRGAARSAARSSRRCAPASRSRSPASPWAWSASSRRGTSRSPSRPGRSRRRSPTATASCSSRPTSCRAAAGRSPTSSRARAFPPACSTSSWARAARSATPSCARRRCAASASPARSTPAARSRADCVARGAKVQLEMGGKNPLVVLDDADLDIAVERA